MEYIPTKRPTQTEETQELMYFQATDRGLFKRGWNKAHTIVPMSKDMPSDTYFVDRLEHYDRVTKAHIVPAEEIEPANIQQTVSFFVKNHLHRSREEYVRIMPVTVQGKKFIYCRGGVPSQQGITAVDGGEVMMWEGQCSSDDDYIGSDEQKKFNLELTTELLKQIKFGIRAEKTWTMLEVIHMLASATNKVRQFYVEGDTLIIQSKSTENETSLQYFKRDSWEMTRPVLTLSAVGIEDAYKEVFPEMEGFMDKWHEENMIAIPRWPEFYAPVAYTHDEWNIIFATTSRNVRMAIDSELVVPLWWGVSGRVNHTMLAWVIKQGAHSRNLSETQVEQITKDIKAHNEYTVVEVMKKPPRDNEVLQELPWLF
jgi:hypothetical protein